MHDPRNSYAALVGCTVMILAASASAGTATKWQQALMLNGVPAPTIDTPGYTTAKCLLPYPVCKLQWAIVSAVAAAEQLVMGGDVAGAGSTIERGFGGDWLLRPEHVSGDPLWSVPLAPVTFGTAIVSGRGNVGTRTIDPFPSAKRDESDVLPP